MHIDTYSIGGVISRLIPVITLPNSKLLLHNEQSILDYNKAIWTECTTIESFNEAVFNNKSIFETNSQVMM